jgi:hypothetical protein
MQKMTQKKFQKSFFCKYFGDFAYKKEIFLIANGFALMTNGIFSNSSILGSK